jgi:hypothetical protein
MVKLGKHIDLAIVNSAETYLLQRRYYVRNNTIDVKSQYLA